MLPPECAELLRYGELLGQHRIEEIDIVRLMRLIDIFESSDMPTWAEQADKVIHLALQRYKLDPTE